MSSRTGFALATVLLLLGAALRLWELGTLQPGLTAAEITNARVVEQVRQGRVAAFYDLAALGGDGGREAFYHTLLASSTTLTGRGLIGYRLPGALLSLVTLALVYAAGRRLYGPLAGVVALALLAVGMGPVILARSITHGALMPLLVAAVLLMLTRAFSLQYPSKPAQEPRTITFMLLGIALGLTLYMHPTGVLVVLVSFIFIAYMIRLQGGMTGRMLSYLGFALLTLLITALPWLVSTLRLPDLNGLGRLFEGYDPVQRGAPQALVSGVLGIFFRGDADPAHNLPGRPLFDLISGVLLLIGAAAAARGWRRPRFLLVGLMLIALLPPTLMQTTSPDFLSLGPLLPPLALLAGLGVVTIQHALKGRARAGLGLGLAALLLFNIAWTARDLFVVWPANDAMRTAYFNRAGELARHLDETAASIPTIFCRPTSSPPGRALSSSQLIDLMMHRRRAPIRYVDCGTALVLANGGDYQQVILPEPNMLNRIPVYLRDWLNRGQIVPGLPPESVIEMLAAGELADTIGRFTTTAPVEFAPEAPGGPALTFPPVRFGGNITFLGYEPLEDRTFTPGSILSTVTYWRVDGPLPRDMRLFTHILSDPANITAQTDTISLRPGDLQPRDVFIQITFVRLPYSTPPGEYAFSIGAYQDSDDMRMVILVDDQPRGTRIFLPLNRIEVVQ